MVLPIGFGGIFLNNILLKNLHDNGLDVAANQVPIAMLLPAMGMVTGLLIAVFFSYRKPREYSEAKILANEPEHKNDQYEARLCCYSRYFSCTWRTNLQLINDHWWPGWLYGLYGNRRN